LSGGFRPLFASASGVRHWWRGEADGSGTVASVQDVGPILEANRVMARQNDGWAASRELRRVASIPLSVILKWKAEEGWDAFDPGCADKLRAKLNDPDWRHLRTAEWRV
jgi:hypothetical protein